MLLSLSIRNIALIDSLEIDFSSGLTILSGETGAGKSIIIDSINFALGGRADKSLIRYGADDATVEAEFDNDINAHVKALLDEYEIEYNDGIIVSRKMSVDGRNVCRINGVKVTASMLRDVTAMLVDIYGQHDTATLLLPKFHQSIIDAFGKEQLALALQNFVISYDNYRHILTELKKYGDISDVNAKMSSLRSKIDELTATKIRLGEEDELANRLRILDSSEDIKDGVNTACDELDGDNGACEKIKKAMKSLKDIAKFNKNIAESMDRLESGMLDIEDVSNTLSRLLTSVDFDEYEHERVEDRLDYLRDVLARYGGSEEEAIARLAKYKVDYDFFSNSEFEVIELNKKKTLAIAELYAKAVALSNVRRVVAQEFERAVLNELQELGMGKTKFEVEFQPQPLQKDFLSKVNALGFDELEFVISPNPGQPLKPLAKIISGGEMSRFMLAIKKITSELDGVNVMVFDEVDTGISGNIATVVARKLTDISRDKQVLAITHLPQLASYADTHYYIEKTQTNDSTTTSVTRLSEDGEIRELARLVGGDLSNSEHAIAHAKDMKSSANAYKKR